MLLARAQVFELNHIVRFFVGTGERNPLSSNALSMIELLLNLGGLWIKDRPHTDRTKVRGDAKRIICLSFTELNHQHLRTSRYFR